MTTYPPIVTPADRAALRRVGRCAKCGAEKPLLHLYCWPNSADLFVSGSPIYCQTCYEARQGKSARPTP